jgi:hypothetical protein
MPLHSIVRTSGYTLEVEFTKHRAGVDFALITIWPTATTPEPMCPFNVTLDRDGLTRLRDALNQAIAEFPQPL